MRIIKDLYYPLNVHSKLQSSIIIHCKHSCFYFFLQIPMLYLYTTRQQPLLSTILYTLVYITRHHSFHYQLFYPHHFTRLTQHTFNFQPCLSTKFTPIPLLPLLLQTFLKPFTTLSHLRLLRQTLDKLYLPNLLSPSPSPCTAHTPLHPFLFTQYV